jgi:hypothetical protein
MSFSDDTGAEVRWRLGAAARRSTVMNLPDLVPWFDSPADCYDELPPADDTPSYDE